MQASQCPTSTTSSNTNCFAAYLSFHLTSTASAYLEGFWAWLGDHDLDGGNQVNVFAGRGILSQSQGPVWLVGTACKLPISVRVRLLTDIHLQLSTTFSINTTWPVPRTITWVQFKPKA